VSGDEGALAFEAVWPGAVVRECELNESRAASKIELAPAVADLLLRMLTPRTVGGRRDAALRSRT